VYFGMGAVGGADDAASAVGPGSETGGGGGADGRGGEAAYADQEYESAG
jgi:hypothetical protein